MGTWICHPFGPSSTCRATSTLMQPPMQYTPQCNARADSRVMAIKIVRCLEGSSLGFRFLKKRVLAYG